MKKHKETARQPYERSDSPAAIPPSSSEIEALKYDLAKAQASNAVLVKGLEDHQEALKKGMAALQERDDKIRMLGLRDSMLSADLIKAKEQFEIVENDKDVQTYRIGEMAKELELRVAEVDKLREELDTTKSDLENYTDVGATLLATLKRLTRG